MTENLPEVYDGPRDPGGTPLPQVPTTALAFALGYAVSRPVYAEQYGGFCALVEELMSRPCVVDNRALGFGQLGRLLDALPPDLANGIRMLYSLQRGQRWAHTGSPDGTIPLKSGNS